MGRVLNCGGLASLLNELLLSHTSGAIVKLTATNWLFYFSNQLNPTWCVMYIGINTVTGSNRYTYKLSKTLLRILMKYSNQQSVCYQLKWSIGWELTGALKYTSTMAGSKTATDKQHWACASKYDPLGPGPSSVWENIFHLFLPRPVENTTYFCSVIPHYYFLALLNLIALVLLSSVYYPTIHSKKWKPYVEHIMNIVFSL